MNILYMTWGEDVKASGLFLNQVYEQLKMIKNENPAVNILVLTGMPIRRKILDIYINTGEIRDIFKNVRIIYKYRMITALSRWFYSKVWQVPFYGLFQTSYLKRIICRHKIDIIHCRSYHSALMALKVREKYELDVKIIFDTRGMFPEEGVLMGYLPPGSKHYQNWKKIERRLFENSDAIVNVSREHTEYVKGTVKRDGVLTIFTSVNNEVFRKDAAIRAEQRGKCGISDGTVVLGYSGAIGNRAWHSFDMLMEQYFAFKKCFNETRLMVITMNREEISARITERYSSYANEIMLFSSGRMEDINGWLNACDYAALPYREIKNEYDRLIGYTMLASKTGEYLAVGLPLIVNEDIGATSSLAKERGIGVTYPNKMNACIDVEKVKFINEKKGEISVKCITTAIELFGSKNNALKYMDVYNSLIKEN